MKDFQNRFLRRGASANPILGFAQQGISSAEFRAQIVAAFAPYFVNHDILDRFAIKLLAAELVNRGKVRTDPISEAAFEHARGLYVSAEQRNAEQSYRCFALAEPHVSAGRSEFWSLCYLERPLTSLALHEFKHEVCRQIGTIIESCLQPILRNLLGQLRIARGRRVEYDSLLPLTLGNIVGELFDVTGSPVYAFPPWQIRLNQWRNMAQHYRTSVRGEMIVGYYGEVGKERTVQLSRDALMLVLRRCVAVFNGVRLASSLFGIDRIVGIKPFLPVVEDRPEVAMVSLVTAIATQGFEVTNVEIGDGRAELWLRDHREDDRKTRMIHASQFVHERWALTDAAEVVVHYCNPDGLVAASFSAKGENCRLFADSEIDLSTYVARMSFKIQDGTFADRTPE